MIESLTEAYKTIDAFTANERRRFEALSTAFLISKAAIYGDQLSPIMDAPLVQDMAKDPRLFHYLAAD